MKSHQPDKLLLAVNSLFLNCHQADRYYLLPKLIKEYENKYSSEQLKYILFDFRRVDFQDNKKEHFLSKIIIDPNDALVKLWELAKLAKHRAEGKAEKDYMILIAIGECDASVANQALFDKSVIQINKFAKDSAIRLIYFTTSKSENAASLKLKDSFELIINEGNVDKYLHSITENADKKPSAIPYPAKVARHSFGKEKIKDFWKENHEKVSNAVIILTLGIFLALISGVFHQVPIPGHPFEKKEYDGYFYAYVFPDKDKSKNYKLPVRVQRMYIGYDEPHIRYIHEAYFPNGGRLEFENCLGSLNKREECSTYDGEKYWVQLTKESAPNQNR